MAISVTDPINLAIKRTREILFTPFDAMKWLVMGFCAWLASFGSSGGASFNVPGNFGNSGGGSGFPTGNGGTIGNPVDKVSEFFQANMIIIVAVILGVIVAGVLIGLIITFLMSRGQFMFIDGIVNNRGAVVKPWSEYKNEANSLFKFMFVWSIIGFLFILVLLGLCGFLGWLDYKSHAFGVFSIIAIALFVLLGGAATFIGLVVRFLLIDFVIPIMYKRRISCIEAWHVVKSEFSSQKGSIILYALMCIAIQIATGMTTGCLSYCMCCVPLMPCIGPFFSAIIFLPVFVFIRSYNLYFLEQFGPDWQFFAPPIIPEQAPVVADAPPGWQNDAL